MINVGVALNPDHEHSWALLDAVLREPRFCVRLLLEANSPHVAPPVAEDLPEYYLGQPLVRLARGARARLEALAYRPRPLWRGRSYEDLKASAGVRVVDVSVGWDIALACLAEVDLVMMAGFSRMVPSELLQAPRLGWVNLHPSLLPAYRGSHPLFWALYECADTAGVTAYSVGEGLDDGPIVRQQHIEISPQETFETLYEKAISATPSVVSGLADEAARALAEGRTLVGVVQSGQHRRYSKPAPFDLMVDWSEPAAALACRSCHMPRTLWFEALGRRVVIHNAVAVSESAAPGVVHRIDPDGACIGTGDGCLLIRRMDVSGVWSRNAATAAKRAGLAEGVRL